MTWQVLRLALIQMLTDSNSIRASPASLRNYHSRFQAVAPHSKRSRKDAPPLRVVHHSLVRRLVSRDFSTVPFEVIDRAYWVEEESWEWYRLEDFYPVTFGEVFNSKYKVVGKLGNGAYGTAWLCRDLMYVFISFVVQLDLVGHREQQHVTLKIGTHSSLLGELTSLRHLRSIGQMSWGAFWFGRC